MMCDSKIEDHKNLNDSERRKIYFSSIPKNVSISNLKTNSNLQLQDSIRGGVVPVFRTCISANNQITYHNLYFLTRHSKAMLSDFGGLINKDEDLIKGCYREFSEETFEYSMFIPRTHSIILNSNITSVVFNSISNTEILKKIHNHDYYEEIADEKNMPVEFLKAFQMVNMKIWNFYNIRLLYNEHRKIKQYRGEICNEIDGIVVLSDFLKIVQTSERQYDDWTLVRNPKTKSYGIETKTSNSSSHFKIFSPIKKLVKSCSNSDINKIHSHISTYNINDKFERIVKNYKIDNIFSTITNKHIDISNYKTIENCIGYNLHNHILYLNCIYSYDSKSNMILDENWYFERPKIHMLDIVIKFFKYILSKYKTTFSEFDVECDVNHEGIQIEEDIYNEIKITACIIIWFNYYVEHINRINRSTLNTVFEKNTELLKKLPNMTFRETYHWMNCLKLSSLKQTMFEINYPIEYVLGKASSEYRCEVDKLSQENIVKQYNYEINYVSNHCLYNLRKLLSVFCKEETVEKLFEL